MKNMGSADRIVRTALAVIAAILIVTGVVNGRPALVVGVIAAVLLITAAVGVCPLYIPLGISTRRKSRGLPPPPA